MAHRRKMKRKEAYETKPTREPRKALGGGIGNGSLFFYRVPRQSEGGRVADKTRQTPKTKRSRPKTQDKSRARRAALLGKNCCCPRNRKYPCQRPRCQRKTPLGGYRSGFDKVCRLSYVVYRARVPGHSTPAVAKSRQRTRERGDSRNRRRNGDSTEGQAFADAR